METVFPIVGLACLLALYPAWIVGRRAYYQSEKWKKCASVLGILVLGPVMASGLIFVPFIVNEGKALRIDALATDFILYALLPAAAMAGMGYVLNQLSQSDRPILLVLASAACLSIVLLGSALWLYAAPLLEKYGMSIEAAGA